MMRFSIREILLLTVIVSMALGWWLYHRHVQGELEGLISANQKQAKELTVSKQQAQVALNTLTELLLQERYNSQLESARPR